VHGPAAGLTRPMLELKGVAKLRLRPGEQGIARMTLAAEDLAAAGPDLSPRLQPGTYDLLVGRTAERKALHATPLRVLA
jgi:beta-glucosidase